MSKRNKKRSVLKKRKRRMNYNKIKAGNLVRWHDMGYKVVALLKQGIYYLITMQNRKLRSVNALSETILYFITKNNEVKKVNRNVKELYFKNPAKSIYQIYLNGKWYNIEDTWDLYQ